LIEKRALLRPFIDEKAAKHMIYQPFRFADRLNRRLGKNQRESGFFRKGYNVL
jgi:hypothetical protein